MVPPEYVAIKLSASLYLSYNASKKYSLERRKGLTGYTNRIRREFHEFFTFIIVENYGKERLEALS